MLDNREGKQQCLDIDYKSTRDKFDEKEEQTNNNLQTIWQACLINQRGQWQRQSIKPAPHINDGACPMVSKPQQEIPNNLGTRIHKCPSPTVNIPNKEGTLRKVMWNMDRLKPPTFDLTGKVATGAETERLQLQHRKQRYALQDGQDPTSMWTTHTGKARLPLKTTLPQKYLNEMCPQGLATSHPAGELLAEWSQLGCPTKTRQPWSKMEMWEAIEWGPNQLSLSPEAIAHFKAKSKEKVTAGQAQIFGWDDIKDNPPPHLKVSPIAAIPHKSKDFQSILDLSFWLRLKNGGFLNSVNEIAIKSAPKGALNQLRHALGHIIHAFAEADDDAKFFMAEWDIKDGFWRMDCEVGEEWNFAYVLPQEPNKPKKLVIPTSLQMGWVESPPYFCAATETVRDIALDYCNTPIGSLLPHKLDKHLMGDKDYNALPKKAVGNDPCRYGLEVYVDNFMSIAMPTLQE
jgi:hypothetical protein